VVALGTLLWEPPADARRRTRLGPLPRPGGGRARARPARPGGGLALVGRRPRGLLGLDRRRVRRALPQPPPRGAGGPSMPGAEWFPGATLNYAEHALRRRDDAPAVIARSQTRAEVTLSWAELAEQVARARAGLERLGVGRGDRVVGYLPNVPETLVAFLACASLGAVWSSCAPEFGVRSVVDRVQQIEPAVLLVVDGYRYGAKAVDRSAEVAAIRAALPTLRATVVLPYLHDRRRPRIPPPRRELLDGARRRARGARLRPGALRPSRSTCCTAPGRPACPRRSSTVTAASCSSTSRCSGCTTTSAPTTGSAGSPPPGG
jgi:acetoacetyl-CoA synthetase